MVRRERLEARGKVADLGLRPADAQAPTVVLKHIDPRAAIGRVNHYIEGTGRLEHVVQGPQPRIGVGQVVQHAGADHVREALTELGMRAPRRAGAPRGWRARACASALA